MLVYPAVDIAKGRCVRLVQGDPERETVYFDSPVEAALHWQALGAEALHVVDLDGTLASGANPGAVKEILALTAFPVQVAGGLRDADSVKRVLEAGAARAVVGTRAVQDPEWALTLCRDLPGRVVVAVDAIEGHVAVKGWTESADVSPVELARTLAEGAPAAFLYTDVSRDGMLSRPHFEGVRALLEAVDVPVIASGGVARLDDVERLGELGADAVIIGTALYERRVELADALELARRHPGRLSPGPP